MVIAISLQKMDTKYAGLADSYYLAALEHLEGSIRPMNLATLQCFSLIAAYSLLTPTRTAVYYIIGLAVRLCQALGLHEEKTIAQDTPGRSVDPLELDMRRRLFWSIVIMEMGLAHSLGRPCMFAMRKDHIDVQFFELVDDEYITQQGVLPAPQASLKKWISIHFFKMRLLQLEIRRMLYQRKRREPCDDQDVWFRHMEEKMEQWRSASPDMDGGSGLNKDWCALRRLPHARVVPVNSTRFTGRYNTMVVLLFRPSPQIPQPSVRAAIRCYDACEYNIHMHRRQIESGSVDLTWIFTQAIFMVINTMLWTLSYSEIRRQHPRHEVERHLSVALESVQLASERWPGVASALELYHNLIGACMKIFDRDGDVAITAGSPSEAASVASSTLEDVNGSHAPSPATASTASISTPLEKTQAPFGYISSETLLNLGQQTTSPSAHPSSRPKSTRASPAQLPFQPSEPGSNMPVDSVRPVAYAPATCSALPSTFADLAHFQPTFSMPRSILSSLPPVTQALSSPVFNEAYANQNGFPITDYLYPQWSTESHGMGLNQAQQVELMQNFEAKETGKIEAMIQQSHRIFRPRDSPS